jgi:TonB family protein
MQYRFPILLIFTIITSGCLFAQERVHRIDKSGSQFSRAEEDYYVLKADKTIKDGPYRIFRNNEMVLSGYYKHDQKDSVWEVYSTGKTVTSRKWYREGQRTGLWEFFNKKPGSDWTYDFVTGTTTFQEGNVVGTGGSCYQSDSGTWVLDHPDKPLIPLYSTGEWLQFLFRTLRYPDYAVDNGLSGTVIVGVVVDENGTITDYGIVQSVAPSLDAEALRVVKLFLIEFVPAEKNGKKIKARYQLPIVFRMQRA